MKHFCETSARAPIWRDVAALVLLMTATLKIMANAAISPVLPALEAEFSEVSNAAYITRFLASAPSLSVIVIAPLAGLFADRFGRSFLLIAGVGLFALSGSAGLYVQSLDAILISRLVLGVAVAMTMTAQVALAGDFFVGERRNAFMGLQTAAINLSGLIYISAAGVLAGFSARLPFVIYALPVLLLPFCIMLARWAEQRAPHSLVQESVSEKDSTARGWLFSSLGVSLLTSIAVMVFFMMPSQLPFYFDYNGFDSASATAIGLGILTLAGGLFAFTFKTLKGRLGTARTLALGFCLMGIGFALVGLKADWSFILPGCALIGVGYALVQPAFLVLALNAAPAQRRGSVSGMITTAIFAGQVISPLLLTPLITVFGFAPVFLVAAAVLVGVLSLGSLFCAFYWQRGS